LRMPRRIITTTRIQANISFSSPTKSQGWQYQSYRKKNKAWAPIY
jgi:dTDP-4-dehydrorhamnose 3,5-epimerase-like enzyme